jgi:hypothetical protein
LLRLQPNKLKNNNSDLSLSMKKQPKRQRSCDLSVNQAITVFPVIQKVSERSAREPA